MLYIVATPIGNLNDASIRQAKTLASSDIILAEDTRSAQILAQAIKERFSFQLKPNLKILSYYKEKEFEKLPEIIKLLKEGKSISLVSESGMPLISDPGYLLVKTIIKEKLPFTVIPGPSAITTSLMYSGLNPSAKDGGFMFLGYLPKKKIELYRLIDKLKQIKEIFPYMIFVFYESTKRLKDSLQLIVVSGWNPNIVICREMTKKFEEVVRGKAKELMERKYRGEITVVLQ